MIDSSCERVEGVLSWTHLGISAKKRKGMQRKLKVAHPSDMPTGGAAVAANRLVRGLAASNEVCLERWVFGKAEVPDLPVEQIALEKRCPKTFLERVVRVFSRKGAKALQNIRQRKALLTAIATRKPDILHLHNLHAPPYAIETFSRFLAICVSPGRCMTNGPLRLGLITGWDPMAESVSKAKNLPMVNST